MTPLNRAELNHKMACLADGDRSAFDFVFEVTWPLVHRFAVKTIGTHPDADDVAQHALMKVFSRAQEFKVGEEALPWILGITSYECKTLIQKVRRRKEEIGNDELIYAKPDDSPSIEEEIYRRSIEELLREQLQELSQQDREAILASIEEAERPPIPPATYRKRLERALQRLRSNWRSKYE